MLDLLSDLGEGIVAQAWPEQQSRAMARQELEKILAADPEHGPHLGYEVNKSATTKQRTKFDMFLL